MSRAVNGQPFLRVFTAPALLCSVAFVAAMIAVLQYSLRAYVPGSLDPGGLTLDNFTALLTATEHEVEDARPEQHDHQRDQEFESGGDAAGYLYVQHDEHDGRDEERRSVPQPPKPPDRGRAPDRAVFADDGRDGDQVVGLSRVLEPEHEAEPE